jgi:hypothetical protein
MQNVVTTPRLFLLACALALGVIAQAAPDGGADAGIMDASVADAADDASGGSCPAHSLTGSDVPNAASLPGPAPQTHGSLDDGAVPTFPGGDIFSFLCVDPMNTLPKPFSYETVKAPYADAAGCKAYDAQGHTAAHNCLCDHCFSLMQQCDAIPSCRAIWKCAEDTGCTNANSCYLLGGTCVAPIDHAGNGSVGTGLSQQIQTCGSSHSCPTK